MLSSVLNHWRLVARFSLPWLALVAVTNIIDLKLQPDIAITPGEFKLNVFDIISLVVGVVASSSIAVSWHRLILIDEPMTAVPQLRQIASLPATPSPA